ncbi:hypothetical protein [Pedobacter roseus]|uniref:Uncharacterized protein n=1 Tax=Pedobacter roseus TaxID=336820 RepID=A0A7G9QHW7_9SPHI|nr:hypothetical protein [Pedobacter roseus]QNN42942.1 hypothetical protein H9L23_02215 [Pedobacter roseus]
MNRKILLLLLSVLLMTSAFAQRRTTSVKGYYRKNGTYVSPHTRSYTAGTSTQYSSTGGATADDDKIASTTLKFSNSSETNLGSDNIIIAKYKGQKIALTKLKFINEEATDDTLISKDRNPGSGIVFYVSVLRYKDKTLDVCPIPRGYSDWSFEKVDHKFDKKLLSTEDALDLISNYGWRIYNDQISKDFSYSYNDKGFPPYLTKTIEAIKVE